MVGEVRLQEAEHGGRVRPREPAHNVRYLLVTSNRPSTGYPAQTWRIFAHGGMGVVALLGCGMRLGRRVLRTRPLHRRARRAVALSIACWVLGVSACTETPTPGVPADGACRDCNIVLVSLDTLRADHLGAYGYSKATSPCIDRFASQAVVFEDAFSASTWTLPSHMSLLTSLHPSQHGVEDDDLRLPADRRTLAEALQESGYRTGGFTAGSYVSGRYGFERGFDVYREDYAPALHEASGQGWRLRQILPAVQVWLQEVGGHKFFLFLHSYDTHEPFVAHPYLSGFDSDYDGALAALGDPNWFPQSPLYAEFAAPFGYPMNVNDFLLEVINKKKMDLTARDREHLVALYDNEIRFVDDSFCQLLDWLDAAGLAAKTIVVLTSDHGEELFERGEVVHGGPPYDELIHVPLIVRAPHLEPGRVERLVQAVDVAPTVLSLVGAPIPPAFRGRNVLSADAPPNACAVSQARGHSTARTDRFKLTVVRDRVTLFDLKNDPGELEDVARENLDTVAALRTCLDAQIGDRTMQAESIPPDDAHTERLRALGYLH